MKICVIQREGIRHFTRFTALTERDKLEVELVLQDKNEKTITLDLTEALIEAYSQHPEIGKVSAATVEQILDIKPIKQLRVRESKMVSPAYLDESKSERDSILAKVKAAQHKAADERKQRTAEINAAKAERLAAARKAKAEKQEAEAKKKPAARAAKIEPPKPTAKAKAAPAKQTKAQAAGLSKVQEAAIKKVGKVLAKEDTANIKAKTTPPAKADKATSKATAIAKPARKPAAKPAKTERPAAKAKAAKTPPPAQAKAKPAASAPRVVKPKAVKAPKQTDLVLEAEKPSAAPSRKKASAAVASTP